MFFPATYAQVALVATAVAVAQPALAAAYIDTVMGEIKPEEKMTVANPQPVQLLIEFQRDGATVPKGTKEITPIITADVKATGLIGATSDTPPLGGASLQASSFITIAKKSAARSGASKE